MLAALEADRVANLGLMLAGGLLLAAIVFALLVRTVVAKVALALVLVMLGLVVWSQRMNLQDCAQKAKAKATGGTATDQCTFLGLKVDVSTSG